MTAKLRLNIIISDRPIHTLVVILLVQLKVSNTYDTLKSFLTDALTVIMHGHTMGKVIFILHILLAVR